MTQAARLFVAAFVAAVAAVPAEAFACSVCFDATDQTRGAFLGTTIFLSLFPLGLIGGIGFYVYRAMRVADAATPPVEDVASGQ